MPFSTMSYAEAEGDLPDVCLRCGGRAVCRVPKTIRLHDTAIYGRGLIAAVMMVVEFAQYLSGPTLVLRGPFCAAHRSHWPFRTALTWCIAGLTPVLLLGVLGLYLAGAVGGGAAGGLVILSAFVCILSAVFVYGTSTFEFGADQDNETITLTHTHPRFIEALERQRDGREDRRAGNRAARAKAEVPVAITRERPASGGGAPFADLDDTSERRPRRRPPQRDRQNQMALLVTLLVGVPFVLLVAVVGIVRMVESAGQRRAALREEQHEEKQHEEEHREMDRDVEPGKLVPNAPARPGLPADIGGRASIDLIPLMNPRKDVVAGRWLVANKALHCDEGSFVPRVQFPYQPPEEYDFIVTFWQKELRNGISLVMPNPNGGSFFWFVGNEHGEDYGFHADPAKEGRTPKLVRAKTIHTTTVRVRKGGVSALLDGKELMRLETNFRDLKCDDWRKIHSTKYLAVACDDPTVFYYVRVVEVTGKGKQGR